MNVVRLFMLVLLVSSAQLVRADAPLSLWNDSPSKTAIVEYVVSVTTIGSPDFIPLERRIAVFDFDGTLFCETSPTYFDWQMFEHRVLRDKNFKATDEQMSAAQSLRESAKAPPLGMDSERMVAEAYRGLSVDAFDSYVRRFMEEDQPGFVHMKRGDAFYSPMVEMVCFLVDSGFTVYVCSGSDRLMVRAIVRGKLPLPPRQIIGSDSEIVASAQGTVDGLRYVYGANDIPIRGGRPIVKNLNMNKVSAIIREIGVKPVLSFGNSMGDASMANYVVSGNKYKALAFMVICDDTERERGNLANAGRMWEACAQNGWIPISMRDDWNTIYGKGVMKETVETP